MAMIWTGEVHDSPGEPAEDDSSCSRELDPAANDGAPSGITVGLPPHPARGQPSVITFRRRRCRKRQARYLVEAGTGPDSRHSRNVNEFFLGVDQSTVGLPGWNRENCAKFCRADAMPVDEIEDLAIAVC